MIGRKIKVVYIAGAGRSGTTLLAHLLGEIEGFFNIGEAARYLSDEPQYAFEIPCGCGRSVSDCLFWRDIVAQVSPEVSRLGARLFRVRRLPGLLWRAGSSRLTPEHQIVLEGIATSYREIYRRSGACVLVDSSKIPSRGFMLSLLPEIELYVVHLVRNPVGVVSSWGKQKDYLPAVPMRKVIAWWWSSNVSSEWLEGRARWYRLYRFEDLIDHAERILQDIATEVTGRPVLLPFLDHKSAIIEVQHSLLGNPDKFTTGKMAIRESEPATPWTHRVLVNLATLPLLLRYGYWPARRFKATS